MDIFVDDRCVSIEEDISLEKLQEMFGDDVILYLGDEKLVDIKMLCNGDNLTIKPKYECLVDWDRLDEVKNARLDRESFPYLTRVKPTDALPWFNIKKGIVLPDALEKFELVENNESEFENTYRWKGLNKNDKMCVKVIYSDTTLYFIYFVVQIEDMCVEYYKRFINDDIIKWAFNGCWFGSDEMRPHDEMDDEYYNNVVNDSYDPYNIALDFMEIHLHEMFDGKDEYI